MSIWKCATCWTDEAVKQEGQDEEWHRKVLSSLHRMLSHCSTCLAIRSTLPFCLMLCQIFFKPFCSMCFINLQDSFGSSKHICCHCNSLKTFLFVTLSQVQISSYSHPVKCYMLIHSLIVMLSKFSIRALANET